MGSWYKQIVGKLTFAEVFPGLTHDTEVCRLDAERERLAREYEAADGALLNQLADHLRNDGSGRWSEYIKYRDLPGHTTPHERMKIAAGLHVPVVRFDRMAAHRFTHCRDCGCFLPQCACDKTGPACQYCGSRYTKPDEIVGDWIHCLTCSLEGEPAEAQHLPDEEAEQAAVHAERVRLERGRIKREYDATDGVVVDAWQVKAGDAVLHQLFGRGTVRSVAFNGDGLNAEVSFETGGRKVLDTTYARLKVLR